MCVTHPGRARLRACGGSGSQSTRFLLGLPVAADRCHGLACAASDPRLSPRGPSPPTALPSRSAGLSGRFGTASYQIKFAVLVFFNWCLSLTTPLLGHSLLCPYVVDVTDTDC